VKCAKKQKKAVERKKKGLDRASIVRDGRLRRLDLTELLVSVTQSELAEP
jgi:hypothetical protein